MVKATSGRNEPSVNAAQFWSNVEQQIALENIAELRAKKRSDCLNAIIFFAEHSGKLGMESNSERESIIKECLRQARLHLFDKRFDGATVYSKFYDAIAASAQKDTLLEMVGQGCVTEHYAFANLTLDSSPTVRASILNAIPAEWATNLSGNKDVVFLHRSHPAVAVNPGKQQSHQWYHQ